MSAVTAACMLVKREAFEKAGGFSERLAVAFNDVDLCLKIGKCGYRVVYDPYAELYHDESRTRGPEDSPEKIRRFQNEIEYMRSEWTDILKNGDPNYNKNLSLKKKKSGIIHCAYKGRRNRDGPGTSIVIPNYNGAGYYKKCLDSLRNQTLPPDRIIVVDNGSTDGSPEAIAREFPEVRLIRFTENTGFCGA